jgi:trans-2,3-dihydro-3-hydroxyanthranilate isomerase
VTGPGCVERRFATMDVFCDRPFAGNPLAVVEDADQMSDTAMLTVAREFGFSETVFLQTATVPACAVSARIFTPGGELPFAGHPTIGTAVWLASTGRVGRDGDDGRIVLQELAGPVAVEVRWGEDGRVVATLTAPAAPRVFPAGIDAPTAARLLSVDAVDIAATPCWMSAGNRFLAVRLASRRALSSAALDRDRAAELPASDEGFDAVYPFVVEDGTGIVHARMFVEGAGIDEDPATGSAAAALAGVLADGAADGIHRWTIHQGDDMGRPSRMSLEADVTDGVATAARVGGTAVVVTRGTLDLGVELGVELGASSTGSYAS